MMIQLSENEFRVLMRMLNPEFDQIDIRDYIANKDVARYASELQWRGVLNFGNREQFRRANEDRDFLETAFTEICDYFKVPLDTPERLILGPTTDIGVSAGNSGPDWLIFYDPVRAIRKSNVQHFEKTPFLAGYDWSDPRRIHYFILAHEVWHRKQKIDGRLFADKNGNTFKGSFYDHKDVQMFWQHQDLPWEREANEMAWQFLKAKGLTPPRKRILQPA